MFARGKKRTEVRLNKPGMNVKYKGGGGSQTQSLTGVVTTRRVLFANFSIICAPISSEDIV